MKSEKNKKVQFFFFYRNNEYQVWNRGNRRLNEKPDSGLSQVLGVNTALPDLRGTNTQQSYNGNSSNINSTEILKTVLKFI